MNKIISSLLILLLGSFSCRIKEEPVTRAEYLIINKSNHEIKFNIFSDNKIDDAFLLVENAEKEFSDALRGGVIFAVPGDSIEIIFDETIKVMHRGPRKDQEIKRSLLLEGSYTGGECSEFLYRFKYLFTDDDYQEAVELKNQILKQ